MFSNNSTGEEYFTDYHDYVAHATNQAKGL